MGEVTRKSPWLIAEQAAPLVSSIATFAALMFYREDVIGKFGDGGWSAGGLYSAIFNWAAIQTGFAFGVYGFVAGKSGGFVEAIRGTVTMRRFLGYVKAANVAGFLLTLFSIPLLVVNPNLGTASAPVYGAVALWFAVFVWAFVSFLRIAHTFGHLSSVKDSPPFFGAGS